MYIYIYIYISGRLGGGGTGFWWHGSPKFWKCGTGPQNFRGACGAAKPRILPFYCIFVKKFFENSKKFRKFFENFRKFSKIFEKISKNFEKIFFDVFSRPHFQRKKFNPDFSQKWLFIAFLLTNFSKNFLKRRLRRRFSPPKMWQKIPMTPKCGKLTPPPPKSPWYIYIYIYIYILEGLVT